jgi:Flp pilus assembly protein TadG
VSRLLRRSREHPRGQSLVEFAVVLPIFILVLVGIIDGGRVIFAGNSLSQAAREGARWGSVQGRSADATSRAQIQAETIGRLNGVPDPVVTVTCERNGVTVASCRFNDILVVTVQSQVALATPLLGNLFGPPGGPTLTSTAKVVVNQ